MQQKVALVAIEVKTELRQMYLAQARLGFYVYGALANAALLYVSCICLCLGCYVTLLCIAQLQLVVCSLICTLCLVHAGVDGSGDRWCRFLGNTPAGGWCPAGVRDLA